MFCHIQNLDDKILISRGKSFFRARSYAVKCMIMVYTQNKDEYNTRNCIFWEEVVLILKVISRRKLRNLSFIIAQIL